MATRTLADKSPSKCLVAPVFGVTVAHPMSHPISQYQSVFQPGLFAGKVVISTIVFHLVTTPKVLQD
jgi:hypothetical protein